MEDIRAREFEMVKRFFHANQQILELGSGDGYQARLLSKLGCRVSALDVEISEIKGNSYFPIQLYDGINIPFSGVFFDRIFSSHVLEHAKEVSTLLHNIREVLSDQGIMIHILPTTTWRLWTSIAHYCYLLKYILYRGNVETYARRQRSISSIKKSKGLLHLGWRILLAGPHGETNNAIWELWTFGASRWRRTFQKAGFQIIECFPAGLFYTGYRTFPKWTIAGRMWLARILGSSSRVYVCRKQL